MICCWSFSNWKPWPIYTGIIVFRKTNIREQVSFYSYILLILVFIFFQVAHYIKGDFLTTYGYDPLFGARPVRRLIQDSIEDKLSDAILGGTLNPGDTAFVDINDDDEITIESQSPVTVSSA